MNEITVMVSGAALEYFEERCWNPAEPWGEAFRNAVEVEGKHRRKSVTLTPEIAREVVECCDGICSMQSEFGWNPYSSKERQSAKALKARIEKQTGR